MKRVERDKRALTVCVLLALATTLWGCEIDVPDRAKVVDETLGKDVVADAKAEQDVVTSDVASVDASASAADVTIEPDATADVASAPDATADVASVPDTTTGKDSAGSTGCLKDEDCDDGKPCTKGSCEAASGCVFTAVADGQTCDDGDKCTVNDNCTAGQCQPGQPKTCDDKNPCTADSCDKATGQCVFSLSNAQEGKECGGGKVCKSGKCIAKGGCQSNADCEDNNACTDNECQGQTCKFPNHSKDCDGGKGKCDLGKCWPKGCTNNNHCNDGNNCTQDKCDFGSKKCSNLHINEGKTCDGGKVCKVGVCVAIGGSGGGGCKQKSDCDDNKPCTIDFCEFNTGKCSYSFAHGPDPCGGKASGKICIKGLCSTPPDCKDDSDCNDGNPCTNEGCCKSAADCMVGKCQVKNVGTGKECNDGNVCTTTKGQCFKDYGVCIDAKPTNEGGVCEAGKGKCAAGKCVLKSSCGDDKLDAGEDCDDGNSQGGDGCSASCKIECLKNDWKIELVTSHKFKSIKGLAASNDGSVYVSDSHAIYKVSKGQVSLFAGGSSGYKEGKGKQAAFEYPLGLATDDFGNVCVADWGNEAVRKVGADGMVTTVGGKSGEKYLNYLGDLDAVPDGAAADLLVVNQYYFVHKWGVPKVGNPLVSVFLDGKALSAASLRGVACVQKTANRHCFVAGFGKGRLYEVYFDNAKKTSSVQQWGGKKKSNVDGAISSAQFNAPYGLAVDSTRSIVYISDNANNNLRKFDLGKKEVFTEIAGDSSKLKTAQPEGTTPSGAKVTSLFFEGDSYLDVDEGGAVYIADYPKGENNTHLRKMTPPSTCPGKMQCGSKGLCVSP